MTSCIRLSAGLAAALSVAVVLLYRAVVLGPLEYRPVDLTGTLSVVSGGTSGIGLSTVAKLAAWNSTVIMPARSLAKAEAARDQIMASLPPGSTGSVEVAECDLSSFDSVRRFADSVLARGVHLDRLVLNAGMMADPNILKTTADGVEAVYQVNVLSHYLLARMLVPALRDGGRVVHVSSSMHYLGNLDEATYSRESRNADPKTASLANSYSDSKLMNVLVSAKMHELHQRDGITSIAIHPGFVVSALDQNLPPPLDKVMPWVRTKIARSTDDGATTQVTAATLPELAGAGGLYLEDRCIMSLCKGCVWCYDAQQGGGVVPSTQALSAAKRDWMWDTAAAITGLA